VAVVGHRAATALPARVHGALIVRALVTRATSRVHGACGVAACTAVAVQLHQYVRVNSGFPQRTVFHRNHLRLHPLVLNGIHHHITNIYVCQGMDTTLNYLPLISGLFFNLAMIYYISYSQ
jgi:hypothetical protein